MWGGCVYRFWWQVTKTTTHTRLASYITIENKWSLGEIKIAGRDKSIHGIPWELVADPKGTG